ncbi:STAS domain-containing protein [Marinobacteraceae bacterium S3BR75-40.1]
MSITTNRKNEGSTLEIHIDGRFDFSSHQAFRDAYEDADQNVETYVVDMKNTTYLDSSALGMLLLLRDYAGGDSANVTLANCNDDVRRILTISNFEQLFEIR